MPLVLPYTHVLSHAKARTLNGSFFPSVVAPPPAKRAPANTTSNITSPYLLKSSSCPALSSTCDMRRKCEAGWFEQPNNRRQKDKKRIKKRESSSRLRLDHGHRRPCTKAAPALPAALALFAPSSVFSSSNGSSCASEMMSITASAKDWGSCGTTMFLLRVFKRTPLQQGEGKGMQHLSEALQLTMIA